MAKQSSPARRLYRMKIGVLMGGVSSEREISLKSGKAVLEALKRKGYDAVSIDATGNLVSLLRRHKVDLVFVCLHGGKGEDGAVQGFLDVLGIPYTGSGVRASAVAMDKIMTKEVLAFHGIPTPAFEVAGGRAAPGRSLGLPLVVKPAEEGSTIGITRVARQKDLAPAIRRARRFGPRVLLEKYIPGREVTVGILGDRPLPVVEVRPVGGFYDFRAKYTPGQTEYLVPAPVTKKVAKKVQDLAVAAHRSLGCCGASRVDLMLGQRNAPFVIEVNTIPGMTETSLLPKAAKASGISFDGLVERILKMAVRKKT